MTRVLDQRKETVQPMKKKAFIYAFRSTLPVMAGYVFLGIAFGLLCVQQGFPHYYPVLMSILIYSGALQFAAVPMIAVNTGLINAFILGLTLSARHVFYGISMLDRYKGSGKKKLPLMHLLTDETFSVNCFTRIPAGTDCLYFYLFVSLIDYFYWNAGTWLGTFFGAMLPFDMAGLDFVLTALFIVLLVESVKDKKDRMSALIGFSASVLALLIFGKDNMVLFAMAIIMASLTAGRKVINK